MVDVASVPCRPPWCVRSVHGPPLSARAISRRRSQRRSSPCQAGHARPGVSVPLGQMPSRRCNDRSAETFGHDHLSPRRLSPSSLKQRRPATSGARGEAASLSAANPRSPPGSARQRSPPSRAPLPQQQQQQQQQQSAASPADPFCLSRFTLAQQGVHERALGELRAGRKESGWMWFIFPSPPYIVNGVERGSSLNRLYALRSDAEATAFLTFEAHGVRLRTTYLDALLVVRNRLAAGQRLVSLLGKMSAPKLQSSLRLFQRVCSGGVDEELRALTSEVLAQLAAEGEGGTSRDSP